MCLVTVRLLEEMTMKIVLICITTMVVLSAVGASYLLP